MEGTFSPSVAEEIRKRGTLAAIFLLVLVSHGFVFDILPDVTCRRLELDRSNLEVVFSCGEWQSQDFTIPNMGHSHGWEDLTLPHKPRMVQVRSNPYQS